MKVTMHYLQSWVINDHVLSKVFPTVFNHILEGGCEMWVLSFVGGLSYIYGFLNTFLENIVSHDPKIIIL